MRSRSDQPRRGAPAAIIQLAPGRSPTTIASFATAAPPGATHFLDVDPPRGWRRVDTGAGPGFERGELNVFVSEGVDSDGRRRRHISASRPDRAPGPDDIDAVARAFLVDGFGIVDWFPSRNLPDVIFLQRGLDPHGDDAIVDTASRVETERRADVLLDGMLCLRSRKGRLAMVVACYAIASAIMPMFDRDNPVHVAVKAIGRTIERYEGPPDKIEDVLRHLGVLALREIEAVRPAPIEPMRSRADALDTCVRLLLAVARGQRDAAPTMARVAAAGLVFPETKGSRRTSEMKRAPDAVRGMVMLGDELRSLELGIDGALWLHDATFLEEEERERSGAGTSLCFAAGTDGRRFE